ncbi:MAG: hypothetical protein MK081_05450 [Flavobacteriales bacterium]|nr:hypothetical protein [Flavobacteriales bacterium]
MRKYLFILLSAFVLIYACSAEPPIDVVYTESVADVEKTVATIGVEGMMCEIACGGKIRKELSEIHGVANASIEYNEGENVNYAVVEYNPAKVNETELIRCINTISDGKLYAVKDMEVTRYAPAASSSAGQDDEVSMDASGFKTPGISDLVSGILRMITG